MEEDDSGQDWLARYADSFKVAKASLKLIWADLKVSETGQKGRLDRVHSQALERWPAAVKEAEQERANVQAQILQAREECQKLAYELGADSTEDLEREVVSGEEPLIDQFHRVSRTLQTWRERRAERLERYQGLQEVCNALRKQMGRPKTPDKQKPDLTENGLQALSVAGDRLQTEVKKQMRELDDVLLELSKTCLMLGEDEVAAAADVHASLRHYKPLSLQQQNVRSSQAHTVPDLSAETFDGLHRKIAALERSKVDRETEADSLHEVLLNLWDLLGIGEDDINRQLTTFAMQGPARLQTPMIAQVRTAIANLETKKAALMRNVAVANRADTERVCEGSRMNPPALPAGYVQAIQAGDGERIDSGQVAEVLHKTMEQLSAMQDLASKRQPLLASIDALDATLAEIGWMRAWKCDANRFSGRLVGQSISRAGKAEEMDKHLPAAFAELRAMLQDWAVEHGGPFLVNGSNYLAQVLTQHELDHQEAMAASKSHHKSSQVKTKNAGLPARSSTPKTPGRIQAIHGRGAKTPKAPAAAAMHAGFASKGSLTGPAKVATHSRPTDTRAEPVLTSPVSKNLGERLLLNTAWSPSAASNADKKPVERTRLGAKQPTVMIPTKLQLD